MLKLDFNERSDFPGEWLKSFKLDTDRLWLYPDREKLESKLADYFSLPADNVFCSNGGDESIYILMRLIKEGCAMASNSSASGQLILPLPAFSQYTWGIKSWKIETLDIAPKQNLSIDIDALKSAINNNPNSTIVLTSPNNPTGESIAMDTLNELLQLAKDNQSWIFLDEAYIEFSTQKSAVSLLSRYNNLIILRTFSKAYGLAGVRLGYLLGNAQLLQAFRDRAMPFNVATPTLAIAEQALQPQAQQDMQHYTQVIKNNREQLSDWLRTVGINPIPAQGNFVFLKLPLQLANLLTTYLKRNDILVRVFTESYLKGCVRITIPYYLAPLMDALAVIFDPELICFDMDGVLIDTSSSYDNAIKATVKEFTGIDVNDTEIKVLRSKGGFNNDWVLSQELVRIHGKNVDLRLITECFQSFYLGKDDDGFINNESIMVQQPLMELLQKRQQAIAIVTGRPSNEAKLGASNLCKSFDVWRSATIVSDDDVKNSKPDPEGILGLQSSLNRKRTWMIGDTPDDMQAAVSSGSVAIGIGLENEQSLLQAGADLVIDSVNQLTTLLTNKNK